MSMTLMSISVFLFAISREALAVNRYNDEQMESMTAGKTTSTLTKTSPYITDSDSKVQ